ncbi:MAG TPA: response regulator [Clostridiales bacterium]|jgi:DNA-binding NtrC family response regulator|nr:response regulator [Clostridiales bacterium]HQP70023.1 response regulator [Clostridiales bacterium]
MAKKILLIDDDTDILTAYSAFFKGQGYEIRTALNTTIGRKEIREFSPDLMIVDVMMEQPDEGFVFAQQMLDEKVAIPIIITSSIANAGQEIFDIDIPNVKSVLQKPVDLEKLSALVNRVLNK